MLELAQKIKKIDLDNYVINHLWFRVAYIMLCNLRNTNSQILLTKTPPGNPINDYYQKKEKERKKKFLQAFTRNLRWIFLICVIYRTLTDHAQID